jgi:hypothetical protein
LKNASIRSSWYRLTIPLITAATTVTIDMRVMSAMYFGFAPAMSSTPIAIATSTEDVPRSGWRMISADGTPTMISPPRNRGYDTSSLRSSAR